MPTQRPGNRRPGPAVHIIAGSKGVIRQWSTFMASPRSSWRRASSPYRATEWSPAEANAVAERLRHNLQAAGVPVTVSIGIAPGASERTLRQSIALADQAVYQAKAKGEAQTVSLNPDC